MEQIKIALDFTWRNRFWFALGLVVLLALGTYPTGVQSVTVRANQKRGELDGVFSGIEKFARGTDHPNPNSITSVEAKESELGKVVETEWERIYAKQVPLMTWPAEVAERFAKRPFGSDLSDDRNRYLIQYRHIFGDQVEDIYYELNPIETDQVGNVYGIVDAPFGVIQSAQWGRTPSSIEAWLAQEELWVQRAIARAVAKANEKRKSTTWNDAAIKRVNGIAIGQRAIDTYTASKSPTLIDGMSGQASTTATPALGMGGAGRGGVNSGITTLRYLEKNEQFRVIPVFVSMYVEQQAVPDILASLSDAELHYVIRQASLGVPLQKVQVPQPMQETRLLPQATVKDDPSINTLQLDVWGVMRLYEMPTKEKAEYDAKVAAKKPAESAAPGAPAESAAPGAPAGSAAPGAPAGSAAPGAPAGSAAPGAPAGSAPPADATAAPATPPTEPSAAPKTEPSAAPKTEPSAAPKTEPGTEPTSEPAEATRTEPAPETKDTQPKAVAPKEDATPKEPTKEPTKVEPAPESKPAATP